MDNIIKEKIQEIFKRIDNLINSYLTKALCKNFIESYEMLKRSYLK